MKVVRGKIKNKAVYCKVDNGIVDFIVHGKNLVRESSKSIDACFIEKKTKFGFSIKEYALTEETFRLMVDTYLKTLEVNEDEKANN